MIRLWLLFYGGKDKAMKESLLNNLKGTENQMKLRRPFNLLWFLLFPAILLFAECSSFAGQPPNGALKVAYHQRNAGKLSDSVHHIKLWCSDGQCNMTTLTLNQCAPWDKLRKVFYPKVQRTSTAEKTLSVSEINNGLLVAEDKEGESTFKYRFTYTVRLDPEMSKLVRLREVRWFDELTGFSGGALKYSTILKKVVTWDLVPLKGRSPIIKAACNILLNGVPHPHGVIGGNGK